jgi:hypothetical protein
MALYPRHAARSPRSPAHPAGVAPLSPGRAPAAERRVVGRLNVLASALGRKCCQRDLDDERKDS